MLRLSSKSEDAISRPNQYTQNHREGDEHDRNRCIRGWFTRPRRLNLQHATRVTVASIHQRCGIFTLHVRTQRRSRASSACAGRRCTKWLRRSTLRDPPRHQYPSKRRIRRALEHIIRKAPLYFGKFRVRIVRVTSTTGDFILRDERVDVLSRRRLRETRLRTIRRRARARQHRDATTTSANTARALRARAPPPRPHLDADSASNETRGSFLRRRVRASTALSRAPHRLDTARARRRRSVSTVRPLRDAFACLPGRSRATM